jgi:CubicO group peptidase (beta-lactamase class C family)
MSTTMPTEEKIRKLVDPLLTQDGVGVVVGAALQSSSKLWTFGSVTAVDGSSLDLDGDTFFAIGSVSKTFTATLYAWAGANADTTVGACTPPDAEPVGSNYSGITLQSLATYSSGLPTDNGRGGPPRLPPGQTKPYTRTEMYDYLATNPFPIDAGQGYAYSNLGFALLGASLPAAVGSTDYYAEVLQANILNPLGFVPTRLDVVPSSLLPQSYVDGTAQGVNWRQYPAYNPAGGLVMSGSSFMKWMQYNMGLASNTSLNSLLAQTLAPSGVTVSSAIDVCLGWFYKPSANIVYKDGGTLGFNSLVYITASENPGTDPSPSGTFIFVNQRTTLLPGILQKIIDILNGTTTSEPAATHTPG